MKKQVILTCEHGGNEIPGNYQKQFKGNKSVLESHKGWDIGALVVAKALSNSLKVPVFFSTTSRLLIELNRSLHHPNLFSAYTKELSRDAKKHIIDRFYTPYRKEVVENISKTINENGEVLHISVHSFTPVLNKEVRNTDIGLLYDPSAEKEKLFCRNWKTAVKKFSDYRVRFNYPYRGTADGFTTYLRKKFPKNYSGIELEVNQGLLTDTKSIHKISSTLAQSLAALFEKQFIL